MLKKSQVNFHQHRYLPKHISSKSSFFFPVLACNILVTCPGTSKLVLHKPFISPHIVYPFQFYKLIFEVVIGKLINFEAKNRRFIMFFVSQFTIPKIGTQGAFINSHVESKSQLFRFYCLLVMSK